MATEVACMQCGAKNWPGAARCFLCRAPLTKETTSPWAAPQALIAEQAARRTFALSSLMLVIALVAVGLGIGHESLGLGIAFILIAGPALVRTVLTSDRAKSAGQPLDVVQKVGVFLGSVGVVVIIFLSAVIAFALTCIPVGSMALSVGGDYGIYVALGAALVAAGAAAFAVGRALWPRLPHSR